MNHGDTTSKLSETLLEFFAVVVGSCFVYLATNLIRASGDVINVSTTVDNDGIFFFNGDALGLTKVIHGYVLELDAKILGDALTASKDRDIFEHCFTTITKTRGFYSTGVDCSAQLVDY